ncbi:MAG TPA: hypothetical protein VLD63_02510, partial [Anaerolineales bacterium]|nr:hypothetical protein [Anaerolineales bacterium]
MTEDARPSPEQARDRRRGLLSLLLLALVIFLALLLCGQVAMEAPFPEPAQPVESGSRLRAEYGPWTFQPVARLLPAIVEEALGDLGLGGLPFVESEDCLLLGQVCPTRTPSATPTASPTGGLSATPTPTGTSAITSTAGPSLTPS